MWPFSEISFPAAARTSDLANWALIVSLVVGVVSTFIIVQMSNVKEAHWDFDRRASALRVAELEAQAAKLRSDAADAELKLEQLRQGVAPRSLTQEQQGELTAKLSQFKDVRGTIVASPSTVESEWFARQLHAPLKAAGWEITVGPGAPTTVLHPRGVIVQYQMALADSAKWKDGRLVAPPGPWDPLVDALNELGIAASAIPWPGIPATDNIVIVISER